MSKKKIKKKRKNKSSSILKKIDLIVLLTSIPIILGIVYFSFETFFNYDNSANEFSLPDNSRPKASDVIPNSYNQKVYEKNFRKTGYFDSSTKRIINNQNNKINIKRFPDTVN